MFASASGDARRLAARGTVSVASTESPPDIFLHERVSQLRSVGLEETPKGLRQQFVQVLRTAIGDEGPRLVGEHRR